MTEPRTQAGRRLLRDWGPSDDMEGAAWAEFRDDVLATEREASQMSLTWPSREDLRRMKPSEVNVFLASVGIAVRVRE